MDDADKEPDQIVAALHGAGWKVREPVRTFWWTVLAKRRDERVRVSHIDLNECLRSAAALCGIHVYSRANESLH